jgi:uncharacterized protein
MHPSLLPPALPVVKSERIQIVDALRGFAVFGILVSHCYYLFFLDEATNTTSPDQWTSFFVRLFVNDKFYSLFSFLFGLSFSLMLSRTTETSSRFYARFAWRLFLLGIIGLLHNLHWNDDILSIYAVLGFILLPVSRLSNKIISVLAVLLLLNIPSYLIHALENPETPEQVAVADQEANKTYSTFFEAMKHGTYVETIKANVNTFKYKLQYYTYSGRFSFMLGFFFLGMISGRMKLFQNFADNKIMFQRTFYTTAALSAILTVAGLVFMINQPTLKPELQSYFRPLMRWQSNILTIALVSGMTLLFSRVYCRWFASQFAIVGKMALTNYVLHSVLGTILLCGYGFGLINYSIPVSISTFCSIPMFAFMILFSHVWLNNFNYGPLEWLWRSGTFFQIMPLRRSRTEKSKEEKV